ncbi:TPA: hypothetical protein QH731_004479 [Klebsiella variicola]|nr:hypothetical protein [Klebsiella variicola]
MVDLVIVLFSIANRLIQLVKDDISHDAFAIHFDVGLYFAARRFECADADEYPALVFCVYLAQAL